MHDFLLGCLFLIWASLIITALIYRRPLAQWWDEKNRRVNIETQILRGQRDGRILRETVEDMRHRGRL